MFMKMSLCISLPSLRPKKIVVDTDNIWDHSPKHGRERHKSHCRSYHDFASPPGNVPPAERRSLPDLRRYREARLRGPGHGEIRYSGTETIQIAGIHPHRPFTERSVAREAASGPGRSWGPGSDQPGGACHRGLGAGPQVQRRIRTTDGSSVRWGSHLLSATRQSVQRGCACPRGTR